MERVAGKETEEEEAARTPGGSTGDNGGVYKSTRPARPRPTARGAPRPARARSLRGPGRGRLPPGGSRAARVVRAPAHLPGDDRNVLGHDAQQRGPRRVRHAERVR